MRKTRALKDDFDVSIEFPLTMGRDFSGIVASKGHNVRDRLNLGDQVWGVVPLDQQGCHAEYVVVDSNLVMRLNNSVYFLHKKKYRLLSAVSKSDLRCKI